MLTCGPYRRPLIPSSVWHVTRRSCGPSRLSRGHPHISAAREGAVVRRGAFREFSSRLAVASRSNMDVPGVRYESASAVAAGWFCVLALRSWTRRWDAFPSGDDSVLCSAGVIASEVRCSAMQQRGVVAGSPVRGAAAASDVDGIASAVGQQVAIGPCGAYGIASTSGVGRPEMGIT